VILWRGLVQTGGDCRVFAIRCPLGRAPELILGDSHPLFASPEAAAAALNLPLDSTQANDIRRFFHFSDHWVGRHPTEPLVLGDLRYANVPTDIRPLWGIGLDPANPDSHASWRTFRGDSKPSLNRLFRIIDGSAVPANPLLR
jgi:inner membrane protein